MDTKQHRLLQCCHFSELRKQHKKAVEILCTRHPDWAWIPLAIEHDMAAFFSFVSTNISRIALAGPSQWDIPEHLPLRLFTGGSCIHSSDPQARRARFSIILDTSFSEEQRFMEITNFAKSDCIPESFKVLTTAHVSGQQTAARGELSAFATTLEALEAFDLLKWPHEIYTDASYVAQVSKKWGHHETGMKRHKAINLDPTQWWKNCST